MKKLFIYTLFSLAFVLLFSSTVSADVIPPNSHSLDRCVKIVNLGEFPEMYLIGYITGPMVKGHETYIVEKDKCLSMGYKFNQLKVLAAKKSYLDSIGISNFNPFKKVLKKNLIQNKELNCYYDPSTPNSPCLDSIEGWYEEDLSDKNVFVSDEKIDPYGGNIDQNNPLVKEEIDYSIAGFSGGKLVLYKSKQTSEYNNGMPKKVETFQNPQQNEITPTPTPSPEPVKRGFWQSIICFFRGLFGRGCQ